MRMPSPDRWRDVGVCLTPCGVAIFCVQFAYTLVNKKAGIFSPFGLGGLVITIIGVSILAVGVLMSDKGKPVDSDPAADSGKDSEGRRRIGILIRDRAQVTSRNARIRNQDTSISVGDDARLDHEGTDIE
jgi:hypothetical protein